MRAACILWSAALVTPQGTGRLEARQRCWRRDREVEDKS